MSPDPIYPGGLPDPIISIEAPSPPQRPPASGPVPAASPDFEPPTQRQLDYAWNLGFTVPPGVSKQQLSAILTRYEDGDVRSPAWLLDYAVKCTVRNVTPERGARGLLIAAFRWGKLDKVDHAAWFARGVWRAITGRPLDDLHPDGVPAMICDEVGRRLAADPKAIKSILRLENADVARFVAERDENNVTRNTIGFKTAAAMLREQLR